MKARDALGRPPSLNVRVLPSLELLDRGVKRVLDRWPDVVSQPEERDREKLAKEMLRRVLRWDWSSVKTSRITAAAFAVFDAERCERDDLAKVREFYLDEIAASTSTTFLDAMVRVYADTFRAGAVHTHRLAEMLAKRASALGARIRELVIRLPRIFSPQLAPKELAELMRQSPDPYEALKELGLRTPHASGLCCAAHDIFVKELAPSLRRADAREQLLRWLIPEHGNALETGAARAVEALLAAWRTEMPPDDVRHDLSERIIRAYNDPRLHRGGIWSGFDPELRSILLRWLTKQDMKFFCDMVDATQDSHMWPPRRDFWLDLYEEGRIDEAWVAFGGAARRYARELLAGSNDAILSRRFGRQLDRGGSTSLLVMRIGGKIVVDGCHSYRTHIFDANSIDAPKLYQSEYRCDQIMRRSPRSKPHNSIPVWSQWVLQNV
ncbi:EH signature domain-containing protein [Mangrovicoccus sp. HB161399]|uniref:EH signature domain-containing protein n=1 Tax=Mangrovicoccus sp. HB161399 TaxID=2720392 RepID=UPI0015544D00|nr:EH signature domain-containing protein [Mangrovicoccus sp. HB161399]